MSTVDRRHEDGRFPVARFEVEQGSWAAAVSTALEKSISIYGICEQIVVKINATTNNITLKVDITDSSGATLYTKSAIPDDGSTLYTALSNKGTQDADFNPFLCAGPLTVTLTPSGVPGVSTATADVYIYVR